MHPERYPDDQPIKIELDDFTSLLGAGWEEIDRNTMGEWYTYLILGKPLSSDWALEEEMALSAAEGWGGDQYLVYHHFENDEDVLIFLNDWDTQADADDFWLAFSEYAIKRWGNTTQRTDTKLSWELESETVIISRQTDQVLWIIAPNLDLAEELATQFPEFQ